MSRVFTVRKGVGRRASRQKGKQEPRRTEEKMQPNGRTALHLRLLMGGAAGFILHASSEGLGWPPRTWG